MIITKTIKEECSDFLQMDSELRLVKYLNPTDSPVRKVKVRKRKALDDIAVHFNEAFPQYNNILQRSLICNNVNITGKMEEYYIYPINGYKFLYAPHSYDVCNMLSNLNNRLGEKTIISLTNYMYTDDNLELALKENYEVLLYNIPYVYAVKKSLVDDCEKYIKNTK